MHLKSDADRRSLIYGPVPSRRLGRSLGIDLIPYKVCSYDCVYCQLGRTLTKTAERARFVDAGELIEQLRTHLEAGGTPDYITLSGSGEPTLHTGMDEIIAGIKQITEIPVALITNSSLFRVPQVRRECAGADLVLPSLDAGDEKTFAAINRPHQGLTFAAMLEGLIRFREEFAGPIWLEVMLVGGFNDGPSALRNLVRAAERIEPTRIQLNTVTRLPAEKKAMRLPQERMREIRMMFGGIVEVIADYPHDYSAPAGSGSEASEILELLARRSCSADDIAAGLRINRLELLKLLEGLERDGLLEKEDWSGKVLYRRVR